MKKHWKWILAAVSLLLVGLLAWFLIDYFSVPRLTPWEKEKVEQEYDDYRFGVPSVVWYDDNGYIEEFGVWRYIGTYGDCYAFLVIGDGRGATMDILPGPFEVYGLSRSVYYPVDAFVVLYNTKWTITYYGPDKSWEMVTRLRLLETMGNRERWLTDEQLEQLTQDIEKIAEAHN